MNCEYGAHDEQMKPYGNWRFTGGGSIAAENKGFCKKRLEASLAAGYYHGTAEAVTPWSTTGQLSCFPMRDGGWGLFARLHRGQDYYNVQFFENTTRLQVGFTYNQNGFFRFSQPATKPAVTMAIPAPTPKPGVASEK